MDLFILLQVAACSLLLMGILRLLEPWFVRRSVARLLDRMTEDAQDSPQTGRKHAGPPRPYGMVALSGILIAMGIWSIQRGEAIGWVVTILFGLGFVVSLVEVITGPCASVEKVAVVELTPDGVSCSQPNGHTEYVGWNDLQRVEIMTTDEGPYLTDVFWILHGTESGCVVPQDAEGARELLARLQELPGFRDGVVCEAMCCMTNQRFLCWAKQEQITKVSFTIS